MSHTITILWRASTGNESPEQKHGNSDE